MLKPAAPAPVRESLADQIDALGTGDVQSRAELARALSREPSDGSVGRALNRLENEGRWEKVERGKWRRLAIATPTGMAMCNLGAEAREATSAGARPHVDERAAEKGGASPGC